MNKSLDSKIKLCDMHVHSQSSHDSVAPVLLTAAECLEKGIFAFAVTDHCDIHLCRELDVFSLIAGSLKETEEARAQFEGKVEILRGVEIGESFWDREYTDRVLNGLSYDVIIGSVHSVRYEGYTQPYSTIDFSKMDKESLHGYLDQYFDDLLEMVKTLDCDVVAHITCPLRYINGKYGLGVDALEYSEKIAKILDCIIDRSLALEVNTSGLGTQYGTLMPDGRIIAEYRKRGGRLITLGSDAHVPENVGCGFASTVELLREIGFDGYYYYKGRKPQRIDV